jgi:hypothetical protein
MFSIGVPYARCLLFRWREKEEKEKQEEEEEKRKKIKETFTTPLETHLKELNGYLRKNLYANTFFLKKIIVYIAKIFIKPVWKDLSKVISILN